MNTEQLSRLFEELCADACRDLFSDYGVGLKKVGLMDAPVSTSFVVCAVIGFTGRGVRGTLLLATTDEPLGRSSPLGPAVKPGDWMGELSNQLLGRLKSKLL